MMWMWGDGVMSGSGWAWMGIGWLTMVLLWAAAVGLVVWVVRRLSDRPQVAHGAAGQGRSPLEIAEARYAQGGIGREEFEQIRADLAR